VRDACVVEIATGTDPNDATADVIGVPGPEAEEQAATGGAGGRA